MSKCCKCGIGEESAELRVFWHVGPVIAWICVDEICCNARSEERKEEEDEAA